MKYLIMDHSMVVCVSNKTVYAKVGDNGFVECAETEATHIWDQSGDVAYSKDDTSFVTTEAEIPEDLVLGKYNYVDGEFVQNPNWTEPPLPLEEQIKNLATALAEQIMLNQEMQEYQLVQDEMILANDYNILLLQEGM